METKERMMQLIAALGLSKAEFERVCGLSNGYVNSIRNTIGSKGVAQIIAQFPQVNKTWLVFGEGEMFNGDSESHPETVQHSSCRPVPPWIQWTGWCCSPPWDSGRQ